MTDKWHRIADQLAIELAPMAECSTHPVEQEDTYACPFCSNRRVYLNYLAAGGTDTRLDTVFADVRSTPLEQLPFTDHACYPGCQCGRNPRA